MQENGKSERRYSGRGKDITVLRSGQLTVIGPPGQQRRNATLWRCRCDCGKELKVRGSALTSGNTLSCGCARTEALQERAKDIAGQRFGTLTALRPTEERRNSSVVWECRCDCGKEVRYSYNELMHCGIRSCGCQQYNSHPLPLHYIDGTCVELLKHSQLRKDNTSGHTGVVRTTRGWQARIYFKGKQYYLGTYQEFNLAVKARERAEEELHGAFLDWYYTMFPEHKEAEPVALAVSG